MLITIVILSVTTLTALSGLTFFAIQSRMYKAEAEDMRWRYEQNPSYDCQLFMSDLLAGKGLFKIERIERENLFFHRK